MGANVGTEQVHDHIADIDKNPVALRLPFDGHMAVTGCLELFDEMIGHRRQLPLRAARGDYHVVGDGGFVAEIDGYDLLGLIGVERLLDEFEDRIDGGRDLGFASGYWLLLG